MPVPQAFGDHTLTFPEKCMDNRNSTLDLVEGKLLVVKRSVLNNVDLEPNIGLSHHKGVGRTHHSLKTHDRNNESLRKTY